MLPNLIEMTKKTELPKKYGLGLTDIESAIAQTKALPTTPLIKVICGMYAWGFKRGMNYQKKQEKKMVASK